jgi:hypothetical protein
MKVSSEVTHKLPADLKKALIASPKALAARQDITPLMRNEWICWTNSVKKAATRKDHMGRLRSSALKPGRPHRKRLLFRTGRLEKNPINPVVKNLEPPMDRNESHEPYRRRTASQPFLPVLRIG